METPAKATSARPDVRGARLRALSEERLLELAMRWRDGSELDVALAEDGWVELVTRNVERIRMWIRLFRHPAAGDVRISSEDVDDVAQLAWDRATRCMFMTFEGSELRAFRAALRTCARNACMDWCRAALTREKHLAGSLDDRKIDEEGAEAGNRYEREFAEISRRAADDADQARSRDEALTEAISSLESQGQRIVISETRDGFSSREIAERHGWTVAAVDKHRSRGLRVLARDNELQEAVGHV